MPGAGAVHPINGDLVAHCSSRTTSGPSPAGYMPVEKLTGVCDDTDAATMIAAQ